MRVKDIPPPTRFMFWALAPFLAATLVILPIAVRPPGAVGWIAFVAFWLMCLFALVGLWNPQRFKWCWRAVGGIVFAGYVSYLVSTIVAGEWFGDGRRSSSTALNALMGLIFFGYPGFMYAVFGRISLKPNPISDDEYSEH